MIYYTADLHLGHDRIIDLENRPWNTVQEMNRGIINRWNDIIKDEDHVYILGDFTVKGPSVAIQFLKMLKGHKHLIRGNHDYFVERNSFRKYLDLFDSIDYYGHIQDGDKEVILSHYPILCWEGQDRGSIHLYGHVHSHWRPQHPLEGNTAFNVGMDLHNFYPVTLEELLNGKKIY